MKEKIYFVTNIEKESVTATIFDLETKQVLRDEGYNKNMFTLKPNIGSFILEKVGKEKTIYKKLNQDKALNLLAKNYFDITTLQGISELNAFDRFEMELNAIDDIFFDINWEVFKTEKDSDLQHKFWRSNQALLEILKHGEKTNRKKTFMYISYDQMQAIYIDGTMKKSQIAFVPNLDPKQDKKYFNAREFEYGLEKLANVKRSQYENLTSKKIVNLK